MVLYHLIRLENVRTNLVSPCYVPFFSILTIQFSPFPILLYLVQLGLEHVQRHLTISALAPLGLASHNDTRWKVRDSHCRLNFVHVLTTFPPAPESVDCKIFFIDLNRDIFLQFRHRIDARKRGVSPLVCVKRRDSNQTMHTSLVLKITVR